MHFFLFFAAHTVSLQAQESLLVDYAIPTCRVFNALIAIIVDNCINPVYSEISLSVAFYENLRCQICKSRSQDGWFLETSAKKKKKRERDDFGSQIGHQMCGSVAIYWPLLLAQRTQTSANRKRDITHCWLSPTYHLLDL